MEDAFDPDADRNYTERQSHYRGRAKLSIDKLQFSSEHEHVAGAVDPKNIERLVKIFASEGCLRHEPEHHVPILISETTLQTSLQFSELTQAQLLDIRQSPRELRLTGSNTVLALHGRHRIDAAKRFLDPIDRWWVVDIYGDGLSHSAVSELRTEYSNSSGFGDGDIFRHLRYCQLAGDIAQAGKWEARLSNSKLEHVRKLVSKHPKLRVSLDKLLDFTGLWGRRKWLGMLRSIFALKCDVVRHDLHMGIVWNMLIAQRSQSAISNVSMRCGFTSFKVPIPCS
jgi:hypothetical protein